MTKLPSFVGMFNSGDEHMSENVGRERRGEPLLRGNTEVVSVELTYQDICTLLESGTVQPSSQLYVKLRAARDTFRKTPKVYGNGLSIRMDKVTR